MDPSSQPTQPLTDVELRKFRARVDTRIGPDHYRFTIDGIGYDGHWAHDTRRLLDEVKRLNRELHGRRNLGVEYERLRVENIELAAKVEAVRAAAESWDLTDKQIDLMSSDTNPVRRAEQWLKLTTMRACAQDLEAVLLAAPGMPHAPAQEAQEHPETREGDAGTGTGVQGPHGRTEADR